MYDLAKIRIAQNHSIYEESKKITITDNDYEHLKTDLIQGGLVPAVLSDTFTKLVANSNITFIGYFLNTEIGIAIEYYAITKGLVKLEEMPEPLRANGPGSWEFVKYYIPFCFTSLPSIIN